MRCARETGPQGEPGEQGEVSQAAIGGTSGNTNAIATLDDPDPDNETLRLKLNELILNGRR